MCVDMYITKANLRQRAENIDKYFVVKKVEKW